MRKPSGSGRMQPPRSEPLVGTFQRETDRVFYESELTFHRQGI